MNNTIQRTFDTLEFISKQERGVTLQEIIREFDYPKSSAFVIVQSLLELGYIQTMHENDKKYCLGINAFQLGTRYVTGLSLLKQCSYYLNPLADKTANTSFVVVLNGINVVYLDKYVPKDAVLASCSVGTRHKVYSTANGRAYMAFMPENEMLDLLDKLYDQDPEVQLYKSKEDFLLELRETKKRGYAMKLQGEKSVTLCYGAPIFDYTGHVIAAVSLSDVYDKKKDSKKLGEELRDTARAISISMGYEG